MAGHPGASNLFACFLACEMKELISTDFQAIHLLAFGDLECHKCSLLFITFFPVTLLRLIITLKGYHMSLVRPRRKNNINQ